MNALTKMDHKVGFSRPRKILGLWLIMLLLTPMAAPRCVLAVDGEMSLTDAVIFGIVEGVTEYLPISSTGHLLITRDLLGLGGPAQMDAAADSRQAAMNAYLVCIQFGAILAILVVCLHRFQKMFAGIVHRDRQGRRLIAHLSLALLPAVAAGLVLEPVIKRYLFGPYPVIAGWLGGGLVILAVCVYVRRRRIDWHRGRRIEDMDARTALLIGVAQCAAMWPGVSRSLSTILGALAFGLRMEAAVEFSFLLGAVTLTAATAYDVMKYGGEMLALLDPAAMVLGVVLAFVTAVAAVKWMIRYLNRYGLEVFGYYRIAIALAALYFYLSP